MNKKYFLIILMFLYKVLCFANNLNINEIIKTSSDISFTLLDSNTNHFFAAIMIKNGKISCGYGGHIEACILSDYTILDDKMIIFFEKIYYSNSYEGENIKYRNWSFPKKFKIELTKEDFQKALNNEWHDLTLKIDPTQNYSTTCQAIVIDNLSIRESPSLSAKKIGRYEKRTEITLYDKSDKMEEIDGIKSYWYKVKVNEDEYGWVYGGYVRIFFEDESLGYSDKELILKYIK